MYKEYNFSDFCIYVLIGLILYTGKDSWPELLGKQGKFAEETIEEENPNVNAEIVLEGTGVREDFRCNRVWVWVDTNGIVIRVPVIG